MADPITPPEFAGRSFEDAISSIMVDNDPPFWVRRSGKKLEVCYHEIEGVVSPVVVAEFHDQIEAKSHAAKLTADLLRRILANG